MSKSYILYLLKITALLSIIVGVVYFLFAVLDDSRGNALALTKKIPGVFELDMNDSMIWSTDIQRDYLEGITLELKKDRTFVFSKPISEGYETSGKWSLTGSLVERQIDLKYNNGNSLQIGPCVKPNCRFGLKVPIYKEDVLIGYDVVFFSRIE